MRKGTSNPPGPRLQAGDTITSKSGPHILYHVGERCYLQKHGRRYWCEIIESVNEQYTRTGVRQGERATRCRFTALILST